MQDDPTRGQTEATIGAYLAACGPGSEVAIRNTQGVGFRIVLTTVDDVAPSKGRLYTAAAAEEGGKAWYRRTGKNCFHPKGQSRLVEPTEAVRAFAAENPTGAMVRGRVNLQTGEPWVS